MKKLLAFSLIAVGALVLVNMLPSTALAEWIENPFDLLGWSPPETVAEWVEYIFRLLVIVGVIITIVLLVIGGVQYLTAAGNEEATAKAKRLLLDAVIGLVIVLAAWALGGYLLEYFGVEREIPTP